MFAMLESLMALPFATCKAQSSSSFADTEFNHNYTMEFNRNNSSTKGEFQGWYIHVYGYFDN